MLQALGSSQLLLFRQLLMYECGRIWLLSLRVTKKMEGKLVCGCKIHQTETKTEKPREDDRRDVCMLLLNFVSQVGNLLSCKTSVLHYLHKNVNQNKTVAFFSLSDVISASQRFIPALCCQEKKSL